MSRCPLTLTEIATVSNLTDCLSPLSHYKIIRAYWEKGEAFLDVMPHSNPHESGLKSSKMQQPLLGSKTEMYLYNGVQWRFKAGHNGSCMHCTLLVLNLRLVMVPGQSALSFFNRHPKHGSRSRVCNWDPTCNSCLKAFSCQSAKRRFQALGLVMVCFQFSAIFMQLLEYGFWTLSCLCITICIFLDSRSGGIWIFWNLFAWQMPVTFSKLLPWTVWPCWTGGKHI